MGRLWDGVGGNVLLGYLLSPWITKCWSSAEGSLKIGRMFLEHRRVNWQQVSRLSMEKYHAEPYTGLLGVTVGLKWWTRCSQLPCTMAYILKRAEAVSFSLCTLQGWLLGLWIFVKSLQLPRNASHPSTILFTGRGDGYQHGTRGKGQRRKTTGVFCWKQVKQDTSSIPLAMKYTNSFSLGHQRSLLNWRCFQILVLLLLSG